MYTLIEKLYIHSNTCTRFTFIGFISHAPNPSHNTRRGHRARGYAHNETYDPLYTHPKGVPDDIP